ncbi:hypothetical protein [Thiocapsa sp.]|uniref:hypothetical protein n=1 Tax=Thiocapsa sp. TaxID=2024551 RepID=UPI0035930153
MNTPGTIDRDEIGTLALTVLVGVAAAGLPFLIAFVRVLGVGLRTKTEGATGVVVVSGKRLVEDRPDRDYRARLETAARVAAVSSGRILILAGRIGAASITEALAGGRMLRKLPGGLGPCIMLEQTSHDTLTNLLPLPRRDLWDTRHYRSIWTGEKLPRWHPLFPRVAMVRTSWGCRMKCSFCIVPHLCGGIHRTRPVQSGVDEIASLDVDHVYFCDDENFIDEPFAWALAEALDARGVKKRYFPWTRTTTVNRSPELLRRWREIGLDARSAPVALPRSSARA